MAEEHYPIKSIINEEDFDAYHKNTKRIEFTSKTGTFPYFPLDI